jgi:hypothetical protein
MLRFIKSFFKRTHEPQSAPQAPYKVEAPVAEPAKCGCGRSPTGRCIGWHGLTEEGYMDKLNLWIAEQAQADKENNERTLD